ncbi:MAG: ABC transporter ATP-binding protein [Propionibacteriales bacterium]|nr:ABC transporter ATP-binding protein [Propionibacteriales bacterium]
MSFRSATSSTPEPAAATIAASAIGLTKVYGSGASEVRALDGVTLDLHAGEFTAIMGPSGSGKSTLMHCLAALDTPTSGQVLVGGTDVGRLNDNDLTVLRRTRIGFVFQAFNLIPTLTAEENILLPLSLAGSTPDQQWFDTVIETIGLRSRLGHRPSEMSGGQQQRVACARALVSKPSIIFADEPTGNLDSVSGAEVLAFLRRSVDEFGQTIVMVTHDAVAASHCDRVVFLADGAVVDELSHPSREEILEHITVLQAEVTARAAQRHSADGVLDAGSGA